MDKELVELIEKIGKVKLLVERIPVMEHTNTCPADDLTGHPAPCKCGAEGFNNAVELVKYELGIAYLQKVLKVE
jgi:hypothetical protein